MLDLFEIDVPYIYDAYDGIVKRLDKIEIEELETFETVWMLCGDGVIEEHFHGRNYYK